MVHAQISSLICSIPFAGEVDDKKNDQQSEHRSSLFLELNITFLSNAINSLRQHSAYQLGKDALRTTQRERILEYCGSRMDMFSECARGIQERLEPRYGSHVPALRVLSARSLRQDRRSRSGTQFHNCGCLRAEFIQRKAL